MLHFLKNLLILTLSITNAQLTLPGSQRDEHDCVLDGGYSWCESTQACQRPWESPCEDLNSAVQAQSQFCPSSDIQMCRMACPALDCGDDECAMRHGNCCEYRCEDIINPITQCPKECPPPAPCPMPLMTSNCRYLPPLPNSCGCTIGCGTVDCSTRPKISKGETCGGFMPYGMASICEDGLECVYTMGHMIADAPGTCQPECLTSRDQWGNCIEEGCSSWFDGCNTCSIQQDGNQICTEITCYDINSMKSSRCLDESTNILPNPNRPSIPMNCVTWYNGCNTCSVLNGELQGCTLMMCFTQSDPYCQVFTSGELHEGEICYRFCEDSSQNPINRRSDCSKGTECSSPTKRNQVSMIAYDSCGERAHTCNSISGH